MAIEKKMLYCDYCGAEMCVGIRCYGERLSCGESECNRMERDDLAEERDAAHELLDRQNGWA